MLRCAIVFEQGVICSYSRAYTGISHHPYCKTFSSLSRARNISMQCYWTYLQSMSIRHQSMSIRHQVWSGFLICIITLFSTCTLVPELWSRHLHDALHANTLQLLLIHQTSFKECTSLGLHVVDFRSLLVLFRGYFQMVGISGHST